MRDRLPENVSFTYDEESGEIRIIIEGAKVQWESISSQIVFPPYAHRDEHAPGSIIELTLEERPDAEPDYSEFEELIDGDDDR